MDSINLEHDLWFALGLFKDLCVKGGMSEDDSELTFRRLSDYIRNNKKNDFTMDDVAMEFFIILNNKFIKDINVAIETSSGKYN